MLEARLVELSHVLACSAVDKHTVEYVHLYNLVAQSMVVAFGSIGKLFAIGGKVDAVAVEYSLLGCGNANDVEFESLGALQFFILVVNLLKKLSANSSHTTHKEVEHLVFRRGRTSRGLR